MKYEDSFRSGYQNREDKDWTEDVHIREEDRGIAMYAVFDGKEQVSDEFAPPQDRDCILAAEMYSKGKGKSISNRTAEERDKMSIGVLGEEAVTAMSLAFGNIEYILGNGEFMDSDINFDKLESVYNALSEMIQYIEDEPFDEMERM